MLYFRNRMEINGKATQSVEWTEAEREELPQHQVCRCLMFCIAGKLRKVPCGMKHCSLLLLPAHHLPLKPLHFFILCVPCPVNANEVVVQTADRHLFSANVSGLFKRVAAHCTLLQSRLYACCPLVPQDKTAVANYASSFWLVSLFASRKMMSLCQVQ